MGNYGDSGFLRQGESVEEFDNRVDRSNIGAMKHSITILMVEDSEVDALFLQTRLSHSRNHVFQVRRADCLAAAFRELAGGAIDLVLLDLGLPDSQGIDTFVRMQATGVRVPIIVLSGLDDQDLATSTVQQGAQDYIVKGQTDGELLERAIGYAIERDHVQKALTEEHDLLRSVIDNIPDQVYLKDRESRFVAVNPATAMFFGASTPDELTGKTDADYFPCGLAEQFLAEEQVLLRRDQVCVNREALITDSKGNKRWVLTTKVPLHDHTGAITGLLGINRDITERKQAEEGIRQMNAELERRVAERTDELLRAVARLEEHDRARAEFVSSVSHELKTPLTSMRFAVSNLLEGVLGPVSESVGQYLRLLDTDCQRMVITIESILDFSRLESKTIQLLKARVPFDRLIRQGVAALKAQAQANSIDVVLSLGQGLGFIECDAFKMMRSMINVIGNAIKFTPPGGCVEVVLCRGSGASGTLVVEVTDNGIGIAPEHMARVTEKYFRVDEHVSGTGLGLPIAKEIVELHGGQMLIQSPPPGRARGTRVSIRMPVADAPTVLIANSNQAVRALIEQSLASGGYRVTHCGCGDDVIDCVRRTKPDAVILDAVTQGEGERDLMLCMKAGELQNVPLVAVASGTLAPARQAILKGLELPILRDAWGEEELLDCVEAAMRTVSASVISNNLNRKE